MPEAAAPGGPWEFFRDQLDSRVRLLASQEGGSHFFLPVGLLLVVDEQNGGDSTAVEMVRRLNLLDHESRNIIDFYYLGWSNVWTDPNVAGRQLKFNLVDFQSCREALRQAGVQRFGGNADLILIDAEYRDEKVWLRWDQAMQLNLSKLVKEGKLPTLGDFLQAIIETSERAQRDRGTVVQVSDSLGLAFAGNSMLDFILEKWGKLLGAGTLRHLATRNLGPARNLWAL